MVNEYNMVPVDVMANSKMEQIISLLEELVDDRRVPRNVKASINDIIHILKNEKENEKVKLNTAISMLDEVSNDPNIQSYTRTQIWNIVSILESVQSSK